MDLLQALTPPESPDNNTDKDPKLAVPYPLRNVLGFTEEELSSTELQDRLQQHKNALWSEFNFPDMALLKPEAQNQYLTELIDNLRNQGIPVDLRDSPIVQMDHASTLKEDEDGDCSKRVQLNHPNIKNDALKVISNIQSVLISHKRIKDAKREIREVPSSPERIQQIVEQANQKNLIDQNIMQSTVYNNTEPIQPTDILRSVNFALEYNQWQLLNSAGAVQKYGQSIETQE